MINKEEKILVEELKRGSREAQRELYNCYSAPLMSIALRYLGSRELAEDLLHDAFIKIFRSMDKFNYRGEGSLRAWASRIVVNAALHKLREEGSKGTISLDTLAAEPPTETPPVERVPRELLLQFIAELPEGYRTVFNLFCIEEYSHREIAQKLGINEKSSSSQLLRAKRLLATKIKSYLDTHE